MQLPQRFAAEVFSVREVAQAAGVSAATVENLVAAGVVQGRYGFLSTSESVRCVRLVRSRAPRAGKRDLFAPPPQTERSPAAALAASSAIHAAMLALVVLVTSLGLTKADAIEEPIQRSRMIFLAIPGPGGGGGGGGLQAPKPAATAEMKGTAKLASPIPAPRPIATRKTEPRRQPVPPPVMPRPVYRTVEPPPPAPRPAMTPQVVAPVVTAAADPRERAGVPSESAPEAESQGTETGGGAGSGQGTGLGEGTGAGIGPGSGGGTGGGPYRPGSGVSAPELLKEVKPEFTEEARRRNISGDVVLEIVVRADGTVGDVKVLQGLGGGLNANAVSAVKQWRFSPARRHGTPVDVMVEVAVAFTLR